MMIAVVFLTPRTNGGFSADAGPELALTSDI
jgi:hypothetical protein